MTGGDFPIDTSTEGVKVITYDVSDAFGNEAKTKTRFVAVVTTTDSNGIVCLTIPPEDPITKFTCMAWQSCCFETANSNNPVRELATRAHFQQVLHVNRTIREACVCREYL